MPASNQDFASLIKLRRQERKLSLRALGEITGLSFSTIARIERAEFIPTLNNAACLAKALGFNLDDINASIRRETHTFEDQDPQSKVFMKRIGLKVQIIESGRRKNISRTAGPFQYVVLTSGTILLISGVTPTLKIAAGTRIDCFFLRSKNCWALAITDAVLMWLGEPKEPKEPI